MDFVFGFPEDYHKNNGIRVFVHRLSKMVQFASVPYSINAQGYARYFIDPMLLLHNLPCVNSCPAVNSSSRQSFGNPYSAH